MDSLASYEVPAMRINTAWWAVAAAIPLTSIGVLAARHFAGLESGVDLALELSAGEYWSLALGSMLIGIVGGKALGNRLLHPRGLAAKASARADADRTDPLELADVQIRESMFVQLGLLDLPACLLLVHSLMFDSDTSGVLAIVYCAVAFVVLRPDAPSLLRDTVRELQSAASRGR